MSAGGFTLFDTAIGRCGLAWGAAGLVAVQLPDPDERGLRSRLAARAPGLETVSPPPFATDAILRIMRLFEGARDDLATVPLDMTGVPTFHRDVYALTRAIPPGATLTYGEVALRLGDAGLARAVGQALGRNPFPIVVPCHRVMGAGGRFVGFTATGGVATKRRMLEIEGALAPQAPSLFPDLPLAAKPRSPKAARRIP
ncbi:methylated-DNA--[protein]-cysteine S-methyltransferase [Segnochrobactrum spirostomi]|uniref:Methylated-DNA--[protein]-cysteine S-methyltransferase n=1 Tax=Segnochrobactrum spirostomi TaxID=2608987 RepID=A0A6A7Y645_9HYPH|nr:methylated-DNA--[protein]-cysteine S-methyltransferase [Segnochrobactrum spirostomi]MQT13568.1 methylated-DNA--[protein]-cysteine S-methyltransferase [Segnochrobactrum spirostomi]